MGEPNPGEGFEFVNEVVGGAVPKEYIPGIIKGVEGQMLNGIQANYPVVDCKVKLTDGQTHPVDSSVMAFEVAGRGAFKEAANQCRPVIMEPVMSVEITTPEEYMGGIIADLRSMSKGRATFGMEFGKYIELPAGLADELM